MPTKRNYRREYLMEKPERRKKRALRNKARRQLMREGKVRVGDGKDVDHKVPLYKGGSVKRSNLRVQAASTNRANNGGKGGRPKGGRKKLPKRVNPNVVRKR